MTFKPQIEQLSKYLGDKKYLLGTIKYVDMYFIYVADLLEFIQKKLNKEITMKNYENLQQLRNRVK